MYGKLADENPEFRNESGAGHNVDGLIYDIGHFGRGMDDFPYTISLDTPGAREVASRWVNEKPSLEVEMPVSDLIMQLRNKVRPYLEQHSRSRGEPQTFEAELKTLEAIERRTPDRTARVKLSPDYGEGRYNIDSIELIEGKKNRFEL